MQLVEPIFAPWKAELFLGFAHRDGRTVLADKRFEGPLVVQKPLYPEGGAVCHAIVVHPPAGIVAGDQLSLRVSTGAQATALLTTPGASKWYRSIHDAIASQNLRFDIEGSVEWLPQETIVFDGARAQMQSEVHLGSSATYIGWEILCLGRGAGDQSFSRGSVHLRSRIFRDGKPIWRESGTIDAGGVLMHSAAGLDGHSVCATLVAAAPQIGADVVAQCRAVSDVAVTLLPGFLIARHLGDTSELAKHRFVELWRILRPAISGRDAQPPRIWTT